MMTLQEKEKLGLASLEAEQRGDIEEAHRINLQIPLSLWLAKCALQMFGSLEAAKNQGLNFSEVEELYGERWYEHA